LFGFELLLMLLVVVVFEAGVLPGFVRVLLEGAVVVGDLFDFELVVVVVEFGIEVVFVVFDDFVVVDFVCLIG